MYISAYKCVFMHILKFVYVHIWSCIFVHIICIFVHFHFYICEQNCGFHSLAYLHLLCIYIADFLLAYFAYYFHISYQIFLHIWYARNWLLQASYWESIVIWQSVTRWWVMKSGWIGKTIPPAHVSVLKDSNKTTTLVVQIKLMEVSPTLAVAGKKQSQDNDSSTWLPTRTRLERCLVMLLP